MKRSSRGGARTCWILPGGEAAPLLWDTAPCRVPGQPSRHLRLQMPGFDSSPLPHHTSESAHRLPGSFGGELGLNSVPGDLFRVTFGNRGRPLEMAGDSRLEQVAVVLRPALCQAQPSSKTARIPNVDARVQPQHKSSAISDCWHRFVGCQLTLLNGSGRGGPRTSVRAHQMTRRCLCSATLSHTMHWFNGFRKSIPPKNRQRIIIIGNCRKNVAELTF